MSLAMNKLKSFLPGNKNNASGNNDSRRHTMLLEPEIGFQLNITSSNNTNVPELNVNLIAARHLPSTFGFKSVQGYVVKVKLFPGSLKFDSNVQTSTWPKFDENFIFPLQPEIKPSIKNYSKDKYFDVNLPEKLFTGHFVVFTMYSLLELPPGTFNRFRGTYRSLRDKSQSLIQKISDQNNEPTNVKKEIENKGHEKIQEIENGNHLTRSETRRNLGSVTCYLEPKLFKKNPKNERYETEEIWLPIKDLTITNTPSTSNKITSSPKGQLELILELCDTETEDDLKYDHKLDTNSTKNPKQNWKSHYTELKRKITPGKSQGSDKTQYLKVTTSKMRCSIKVKEEFEQTAGQIYIKTSIFENNILVNCWKCDNFLPSISSRWDPKLSTIILPLYEKNLSDIIIKSTVATKNKVSKKIIFGTILIGPQQLTQQSLEHWEKMILSRNEPISMWHNFQ